MQINQGENMIAFLLSIFLSTSAHAIPLQLTQQGRLLDGSGAAVTGLHVLTFRIYDEPTGGSLLWEEAISENFVNGYYASVLGSDTGNNPLDSSVLSLYPLYIELELDSNGPMSPRQEINSAPYSHISGVAESVDGGVVNASNITINGQPVVDSTGKWVGSIMVDWNAQIANVPSDIADGDDNTQLSEQQVEDFVCNDPVNLAAGSTMNQAPLLTTADTLMPNWSDIQNRPSGLDDGDDVGIGISCLDNSLMVYDTSTQSWVCLSGCANGEQLVYENGDWVCQRANYYVDKDADLILAWNDCDDEDAGLGAKSLDSDCDGVLTSSDCDDNDSTKPNNDADCDGVLSSDDCDDNDNTVGACNSGLNLLGYTWFIAGPGETCNTACGSNGLSCIDYVAAGFVEQGCSVGDSVCLSFYPTLSCSHDGDGPSVDYSNGVPSHCRARLSAGYTFDACNYNANGQARSQMCACQ